MHELSLHPDAAKRFNDLGKELLHAVSLHSPPPGHKTPFPEPFITAHLTDKDIIGQVELGAVNGFGDELAKFFEHGGETLGLVDESFQKFLRTAEAIHRTSSFRQVVSLGLVKAKLFSWIQSTYCGQVQQPLSEYLLDDCATDIAEYQVWIPISYLQIQSRFPLGEVQFYPITRELIDSWASIQGPVDPTTEAPTKKRWDSLRKRLQGYTAAVSTILAEPERASEIAVERAEASLAMLRLYHPATLHPRIVCYSDLLGREHVGSTLTLLLRDRSPISITEEALSNTSPVWQLPSAQLTELSRAGLARLHEMLRSNALSQYDAKLMESLRHYSRVSLSKDLSDKMVYLMTALESFMLQNKTEGIQQNLAERMAMIVGRTVPERSAIITNVKTAYGLRSALFHHAERIDDLQTIGQFMLNVWILFVELITNERGFSTQSDFLASVDKMKLGGS